MSKEKRPYVSPDEKLEMQFDYFIKRSINNVTRNVLRTYSDKLRKEGKRADLNELEMIAAPEEVPEIEKIKVDLGACSMYCENERLAKGIEVMPLQQRQIIGYAYVLGLSNKEIAELMHLQEKTILNYRSKIYAFLWSCLEDD